MQSVINLPIKDKNDVIVFLSSDVMRERAPITQSGYKEGYLTKRGKNFGGWKTRYFVLQGPILEYYENVSYDVLPLCRRANIVPQRGGTHLGSIPIAGAQIGRQQNSGRDADDDNEYRHAFLIIEAKRGPTGLSRHVLCAESDEDRDAWVDVLVKYISGTFDESATQGNTNGINNALINPSPSNQAIAAASSTNLYHQSLTETQAMSTSSLPAYEVSQTSSPARRPNLTLNHEAKTSNASSKLAVHDEYIGLPSSPIHPTLPVDRYGHNFGPPDPQPARQIMERSHATNNLPSVDATLSSSLPSSSPLDNASGFPAVGQRAASELGHYPDLIEHQAQQPGRSSADIQRRAKARASFHPSLQPVMAGSLIDRAPSPGPSAMPMPNATPNKADAAVKPKISGPIGGIVIPAGMKFGGKDAPPPEPPAPHNNDRERKAKSRTFWGFGRQGMSLHPGHATMNILICF